MKATLKDGVMYLEVQCFETPVESNSKKTMLVASERANTTIVVDGKPVTVALNAYISSK